jgi:hypothetical protein
MFHLFPLQAKGLQCSSNSSSLTLVLLKAVVRSQAPVAHTCNPSYSGGRDQEDHSWKPVEANSSGDSLSKIPNTKQGWRSGSSGKNKKSAARYGDVCVDFSMWEAETGEFPV